ncbi:MAG: DUF2336 domain-containing protein [Xanthobacteraceae bacterium]
MTSASQSLLAELDTTLGAAPATWRRGALRQILALFVAGAPSYNHEQVALFDDVIGRLIMNPDRELLIELSETLAPVENGPVGILCALAGHRDIAIAGSVLEQAKAIPDVKLIAIADNERVDPKLLAKIAARDALSETLTDILLKRGDRTILRKIIDNPKARVSEGSFARIIMNVNGDKSLANAIAARGDVPEELRMWLTKVLEQP